MTKQVFPNCMPVVRAGSDVPIELDQTLADRLTLSGPNVVNVVIDGPQTVLPADMIAGVYPAPGSDQSPDEFLPHIALTRRTLPWEREGPTPAPSMPWMVLLLFAEPELRSANARLKAPTVSVVQTKVQAIADASTRNRLMGPCGISGDADVSTLTVPNAVLSEVMPKLEDVPLLCHMKREDVNGVETDSAIVICNRLPSAAAPAGERPALHTAALVSVEHAPQLFSLPATGSTTLLVLHHWTFRPDRGGDFEQVIKSIAYRPHGGVQRFGNLPTPARAGDANVLSGGFRCLLDDDGFFLTGVAHDQPVDATYRGPLRPFGPQPRGSGFAIAAQPSEFTNAAPGTPLDFAHAAAFELGRLLALNSPEILDDLRHVRGTLKPIEPPVAKNPLPDVLQKPDWVVNPEWTEQPWDGLTNQSLVKDENLLLDKGTGDITGVGDHVGQWNVGDLVATLTDIGAVVTSPVTAVNVGTFDPVALEADFADVAQAAHG